MEQVKKGYKKTEVGVIPEDWEIRRIGSIGRTEGGYAFKSSKFIRSGKYQVVKMSNVYGNHLDLTRSESFLETIDSSEQHYILKNGDILITLTGTVGKRDYGYTFLIKGQKNLLLNQRVARIISNNEVDFSYVFFQTRMPFFVNQFFESAKGGTGNQANVGTQQVDNICLPIPKIPEQKAIATALSDVDELITKLEKLIEKKKAIKQGAMQQLLTPPHKGGKRLDGFSSEWEEVNLREIIWFQEGPGVRKHQFTSRGVKLLNGSNIQLGQLFLDLTDKYISEDEAYGWYSHFLVDEGDILIACSGITISKFDEKVTLAEGSHLPLCMNTSTMRFKIKSNLIDKGYFMHFLKSMDFKKQIGGEATGSAQLNFGPSHVQKVTLVIPKIEEQIMISEILSKMDSEIKQLENKYKKMLAIKQGMMQELLTGKTRLI